MIASQEKRFYAVLHCNLCGEEKTLTTGDTEDHRELQKPKPITEN
jgi:hypothetical protein